MRLLSPEPGLRSGTDGMHKKLAQEALDSLRQLDQLMRKNIIVTPFEVCCHPWCVAILGVLLPIVFLVLCGQTL
jgi:hypothetical protein